MTKFMFLRILWSSWKRDTCNQGVAYNTSRSDSLEGTKHHLTAFLLGYGWCPYSHLQVLHSVCRLSKPSVSLTFTITFQVHGDVLVANNAFKSNFELYLLQFLLQYGLIFNEYMFLPWVSVDSFLIVWEYHTCIQCNF